MTTSPIWPSIAERVRPQPLAEPPFAARLREATSVLIATSAPSPALFDFLFRHLVPRPPGTTCQLLLGINPVLGTQGLAAGLRALSGHLHNPADSTAPPTIEVRLLTPGRLGGARPRFELAIVTHADEGTAISIGSSPGIGLGTLGAGDLNLWTPLEPSLSNGLREFALALWSIAAPLTPALCEVPDLLPPSGNDEGRRLWSAYEAELARAPEPEPEADAAAPAPPARTIEDIPVDPDGNLDEQKLVADNVTRGESAAIKKLLDSAVPAVPPLQITLAGLFARGSLMAVGKQAKPLAVPIPPSMFGQSAETKVGTAKQTQKFSIELFGDPKTRAQIEKLRTGTHDLLKRFSFSFGLGRYWVPDTARKALDAAVLALDERAQKEFGIALSGDPDKFLQGRRSAIESDLKDLHRRLVPGSELPGHAVDAVLALLKERVDAVSKGSFVPTLSASRVAFDTASGDPSTRWTDALTLLRAVAKLPRDLLNERYPESTLKGLELTVPKYLGVMNVLGDQFTSTLTEDNWKASWIAREAAAQLAEIERWESSSDLEPEAELQQLLDLLKKPIQ